MKILHFLGTIRLPLHPDGDATGGVTRATLEIARAQVAMGHEVWVASVAGGPGSARWQGVRLLHLRSARWAGKLRRRWPNIQDHLPLVTTTAMRAFDVVHVHEHWSTRWIRARACVVHVHNDPFGEPGVARFERKARSFWSRVRYSQAQIGVSAFIAQRLREGLRVAACADDTISSIHTVHNGVERKRFTPERFAEARSRLREQWRVRPEDVAYLFAGAITPLKGSLVMARAFARCSERDPRLHLVLAGGPALWRRAETTSDRDAEEYEAAVQSALEGAAHRGRVHALGVVSPDVLSGIYAASDVVVVPSVGQEAFGLVVAEAMAAGKAVIASAVGGVPEVASEETALLVPADDAIALGQAISQLAGDPALRARLGNHALERVQRFSWEDAAAKLEAIYRSAMLTSHDGLGRGVRRRLADSAAPLRDANGQNPLPAVGRPENTYLSRAGNRVGSREGR